MCVLLICIIVALQRSQWVWVYCNINETWWNTPTRGKVSPLNRWIKHFIYIITWKQWWYIYYGYPSTSHLQNRVCRERCIIIKRVLHFCTNETDSIRDLGEEIQRRLSRPGVALGMAYTSYGGEVLFIETALVPAGSGRLKLTGSLGKVCMFW